MSKISIITAAFRGELMPRAWESIKKQTFTEWEWVIVNDGQNSVRYWYSDFIRGEGKEMFESGQIWMIDSHQQLGRFGLYTRNMGVMAARCKRVCFLDDDNEWTEDHLQSMIDTEFTTGKIPYCYMHIKGKKPGSTFEKMKRTGFSKQGIDLGCILYRKKHFEEFGYFRDDAQVTFDWNAIERLYNGLGGASKFACTNKESFIFHHKRY
jgi:glycosyltransferase involved in cell wall biosynthesis